MKSDAKEFCVEKEFKIISHRIIGLQKLIAMSLVWVALINSAWAFETFRPTLEHLPSAEVIVAAEYIKTNKNNCMKLKKEFAIKGEVKRHFYVCRLNEVDLDLDYIKNKFKVILFLDRKDDHFITRFSYHSVAYINKNNCVAMPSVVDDETGDLILERFENFAARFGAQAPEYLYGKEKCDVW